MVSKSAEAPPRVKLLSQGRWIESTADDWDDIYNPSTGGVIARVPLCGAAEVDQSRLFRRGSVSRLERYSGRRACPTDVSLSGIA